MRSQSILLLAAVLPAALSAVQTGSLVDEGYADFYNGELQDVSLSRDGELSTAPGLTEVAELSEPYVWRVVEDGAGGFFLGTGVGGKVLHLDAEGAVSERFAPDSALARGLARDEAGNLYVGTSPNGAVFRLPAEGGKPELFYDPAALYIWDLRVADGALWIATGKPAQFLRLPLDGEAEEAEVWFSARDDHLTTMAWRGEEWLLGSSPRGIVYAIAEKDAARAIFKSNQEEIRALAPAPDGSVLIATFSDKESGSPDPDTGELAPLVVSGGSSGGSSALGDGGTGEGYLVRLDPQGIARAEWRSNKGGIYSLAAVSDSLWLLGFSRGGKLFGFADRYSWEMLQQMPKGGEVSAIVPDPESPGSFYLFTSNPGFVYRLGGTAAEECVFSSRVLDARQAVRWGRLETTFAREGAVTVETRTGLTDEPDTTWSDWAELDEGQIASPRGRFFQYRLRFPGDSTARFLRSRAFHTMPNAAPLVSRVKVLGFGAEVRLAQMSPPMIDYSAVFKEAQLEKFEQGGTERLKLDRRPEQTLRTLVWMAGDANGDELTYDVFSRRVDAEDWIVMARDLTDPAYLFNAAGLAPGEYQFKVVASDARSNEPDRALTAELTSELVLLDATPPVLTARPVSEDGRTYAVEVTSDASHLVAAQVIVDGGDPISLRPADGLFDETSEVFSHTFAEVPAAGLPILFEVLDESGNQAALSLRTGK